MGYQHGFLCADEIEAYRQNLEADTLWAMAISMARTMSPEGPDAESNYIDYAVANSLPFVIEECEGTGVLLDRDCYGITVSANVIAHEFQGGIDLRDAHGCAVSANTFTIVHEFGVRVSPDSGRITITGNNFSNSYLGDGVIKRADQEDNAHRRDTGPGVRIEKTKHVVINGNLFAGMDGFAVDARGMNRKISVMSNVVTDIGRRAEEAPGGFTQRGNYEESIIKDNIE